MTNFDFTAKRDIQKQKPAQLAVIQLFAVSLFVVMLSAPLPCFAGERDVLMTGVKLNEVTQTDCTAEIDQEGDNAGGIFLQAECVAAMQIDTKGALSVKDTSGSFFDLKNFPGLSYKFDEKKLSLSLTVDPARLPLQTIENDRRKMAQQQSVYAGFLNYAVQSSFNNINGFSGATINNQLGLSKGDTLFLSDGLLTKNSSETHYTRLMSSIIHNDRGSLIKTTIGDATACGGPLSSSTIIGGGQIAKNFDIDPYINTHPTTFSYQGLAQLGGEVDVYANGQIIKTARIQPGQFSLMDLQGYSGAGSYDVVVKDPYGNTQTTTSTSFYATDSLLKAGLSDYNYSLGALRPAFGQNDTYSAPAFLYWHKKGITDRLTLGIQGEVRAGLVNQGISATQQLGQLGIFTATAAGSLTSAATGAAGFLGYSYNSDNGFSATFSGQAASPGYHIAVEGMEAQRTKNSFSGSLSYGNGILGNLSGQFTKGQMFDGSSFIRESASYSRSLSSFSTLSAMIFNNKQGGSNSVNAFLTLTFNLDARHMVTTGTQMQGEDSKITAEVSKSLPAGEGYGYDLKTAYSPKSGITNIQPTVNINARNFITQIDGQSTSLKGGWNNAANVNFAGGVIFAPGTIATLTRPVTSSFAVVDIGAPLSGIKVYSNNLPVATTDSTGKAIISDGLIAYNNNNISLGGADIPIDYQISKKSATLNTAYRSGNRVCLPVFRLQSLTAILVGSGDKGPQTPIDLAEVTIHYAGGRELVAETGTDGELYIDVSILAKPATAGSSLDGCDTIDSAASTIKPGAYAATVSTKGKSCSFTLTIPDQVQSIVDLGTIVCKPIGEEKT